MPEEPRVAFLQDAARLHYAIPIALQREGLLERAFCDWYSAPGSLSKLLSTLMNLKNPVLGRRMLERYNPALDAKRVFANPRLLIRQMRRQKNFATGAEFFQWGAAERAKWILRKQFGGANMLMGFVGSLAPELIDVARARGMPTMADQIIASAAIDQEEDRIQRERFPDWAQAQQGHEHQHWMGYEQESWKRLDHITCASNYVRDGLIRLGLAGEKITVLPYPIDTTDFPIADRSTRTGPITVGFVGAVNLRKGSPYFLQVARRFDPAKVKFVMVGPVQIPEIAACQFAPHVELVGSVPRSEIPQRLARFDIYFFPSTCEGSAGSISEAMSTGLPIVASPNSGSVIAHGREGFLCNYDDIDAAAGYIERLTADRDLRLEMGRHAAAWYRAFNINAHAARLRDIVYSVFHSVRQSGNANAAAGE